MHTKELDPEHPQVTIKAYLNSSQTARRELNVFVCTLVLTFVYFTNQKCYM